MHYLQAELHDLLRDSPSTWDFIQRGSLDGVWYWDLENPEHEWMSPELWWLFGIDPATKRHDPAEWQDIIFAEDLAVALDNFQKHCADPDHPYDQIVRYRHADGSTVWVRCRGLAVRDETGKPIRMLGAHNDLTAVKRAEEAAIRDKREIEHTAEELRAFARSVSHDLKAPSNTIRMLLAEIERQSTEGLTRDQRELMALARGTADRMCTLVDNLLDYARLIGGTLTFETVPLGDILADVVGDLAPELEAADAVVDIGPLPALPVDRFQIDCMFRHMILNAINYARAGAAPQIRFRDVTGPDTEMAAIEVTDNGVGIDAAHGKRMFEMFKRLHRADEAPGSGLGLTLCRRVATNHGGTIDLAKSTPGQGTTFMIKLPKRHP